MANRVDISKSLAELPPFPQIANDLLYLLKDPDTPMQRIVSIVEKDVSLTAATLKLANSGLYGRRRSVGSVRAAFRALGSDVFSQIVIRNSVKSYVSDSMPAADLNRCWAHSIACSEISRILAVRLGMPPDIALCAGLLHDIGRFGLAIAAPAKHNQLLNGDCYTDIIEAERELFGLDHTEAGRILAEQFHLPDEIRIAAGRHHDPISGDEPDTLAVVSVACGIASAVGFQVVASSIPRSLDDVIASAPAPMRDRISPNIETWMAALLNVVATG